MEAGFSHIQSNIMCIYCIPLDKDKSKIFLYSTTLLGIFTCGTSLLLWLLYKECCGSKDKYDVEGTYVYVYSVHVKCVHCDFYYYYSSA